MHEHHLQENGITLQLLKQKKHKAERDWKKCKCIEHDDILIEVNKQYRDALNITRSQYLKNQFDQNKSDPKTLYKSIERIMGDNNTHVLPSKSPQILAEEMTQFYDDKIKKIRAEIEYNRNFNSIIRFPPTKKRRISCSFDQFNTLSTKQVAYIITGMSNKNHPSDPIPMWLAKLTLPELLSSYQTIINK